MLNPWWKSRPLMSKTRNIWAQHGLLFADEVTAGHIERVLSRWGATSPTGQPVLRRVANYLAEVPGAPAHELASHHPRQLISHGARPRPQEQPVSRPTFPRPGMVPYLHGVGFPPLNESE